MEEENELIRILGSIYSCAKQLSQQGWTKIIIPPQSHRRQPKTEREACPFPTRPTLRIIISRPLVNPARLESSKSKHRREQEGGTGSRQLHLKLTPATSNYTLPRRIPSIPFSVEESSEYLKGSLILLTEILKVLRANKLDRRIVKQ